ncbi:growth-regulating factor 5 [Senna tora]|uniref:Growth-regulating factor n=1 Tax=Senna tora TaxID=362788 RepID=A0A834T4G1_9FABA|nr:growth-regulating factor 5 [Senna tora]
MMSSSSSARNRPPFTPSQWQELEQQALVFKYMVSGTPIPPDLIFSIKTSLDSSISSRLFPHHPIGWGCFEMGFGRKVDPEPGRCRRTDGKKWRCSKEAYPDSKYCEKHMHRDHERAFFPEASGSNNARSFPHQESYQQQLSMSSYNNKSYSNFQNLSHNGINNPRQEQPHCFVLGTDFKSARAAKSEKESNISDETTQRPLHHFFGDQWPPKTSSDSWLDLASNSRIPTGHLHHHHHQFTIKFIHFHLEFNTKLIYCIPYEPFSNRDSTIKAYMPKVKPKITNPKVENAESMEQQQIDSLSEGRPISELGFPGGFPHLGVFALQLLLRPQLSTQNPCLQTELVLIQNPRIRSVRIRTRPAPSSPKTWIAWVFPQILACFVYHECGTNPHPQDLT